MSVWAAGGNVFTVLIYLAGILTGLFFAAVLLCLILAHRPTPPTKYRRQKPPEVAQMPVVEAGCVSYQFLGGVTGLEDE